MGQMLLASSNIHKLMSDCLHTPEQEIRLCDPVGFRCNHFICHSCEWKVQVVFFFFFFFFKIALMSAGTPQRAQTMWVGVKSDTQSFGWLFVFISDKSRSSLYTHDCNDVVIHLWGCSGGGQIATFWPSVLSGFENMKSKNWIFSARGNGAIRFWHLSLIAFFTEAENNFCRLLRRFDVLVRKQKDNTANLCRPPHLRSRVKRSTRTRHEAIRD